MDTAPSQRAATLPLQPDHVGVAAGATSSGASPALLLEGLHKSFGAVHAVRGLDLRIEPGEIVAFLGPNGAGKTTTIDMVLGLAPPDRRQRQRFRSPAAGGGEPRGGGRRAADRGDC